MSILIKFTHSCCMLSIKFKAYQTFGISKKLEDTKMEIRSRKPQKYRKYKKTNKKIT